MADQQYSDIDRRCAPRVMADVLLALVDARAESGRPELYAARCLAQAHELAAAAAGWQAATLINGE